MKDYCLTRYLSTVKSIPDVLNGQYGQPMGIEVAGKQKRKFLTCSRKFVPPSAGKECWLGHVRSEYDSTILRRTGVSVIQMRAKVTNRPNSCTVTTSRIVYAYSRDGALPGSRWLRKVNKRTQTPIVAVWFVTGIGALLGLLVFAGPVAIGAVFSIGAIAQYTAFTFPVFLKLVVAGDKFRPGEWDLCL